MKTAFRRILCLLLAMTLAAGLLAGCEGEESLQENLADAEVTATPTETSTEQPTEAPTEAPTEEPTEEPTEAPTEAATEPAGFQSYLETVYLADLPIFSGPSYDEIYVGTVEESGVYTIVEEAWDWEGNLWGRLKSGAGWINLTDSRIAREDRVPVSASLATSRLLGKHHEEYIVEDSEYATQIALRFYEDVTDVCVSFMDFGMDGFFPIGTACVFSEAKSGMPLVLHLGFPGDMSCYGLTFTDSSGTARSYIISLSGRNGLVVLAEES